MRVSLINLNLVNSDAIGQSILHQVRYHQRHGDEVRVYVLYPPEGIPENLLALVRVVDAIDLLGRQDEYFQKSDLYVYHYPGRYALLDTIKTLDHGAVVFYYHNVTPPELWGSEEGRAELAQGQAAVAKFAPLADIIVTDSTYNAEELQTDHGVSPQTIRVIPLAAPKDQFKPGEADLDLIHRYNLAGKEVLLYVGRVAGNKRVDLLVEALAKVKQARPKATLLIVGDNNSNNAFAENTKQILVRAAELGLQEDVIFTGRVADLPPYYRLATLYVSASLHEGFGVPLIEAMASGVPIVTTAVGSQPWVIGDAGVLVEAGDVDALAEQIITVLNDDTLQGELVQRGLRRAVDFSLEAYYNQWGRVINEVKEWLVDRPARPLRLAGPPQVKQGNAVNAELLDLPLEDEIKQLHQAAESVLKPYELRSGAPVVGPLIVWIRRNLTSHLREPYLDPTLRRQERFNWLVVQTMRQVNRLFEQANYVQTQQAQTEARVAKLETQLTGVLDRLANDLAEIEHAAPNEREQALATLRAKVDALRDHATEANSESEIDSPRRDSLGKS